MGRAFLTSIGVAACAIAGLGATTDGVSAPDVRDPSYTVVDLTPAPSGEFIFGQALGVSGHDIVGAMTNGDGNLEAARWSSGNPEMLGTLGGSTSAAHDGNVRGGIVGESLVTGDVAVHAFYWRDGLMTDLGTLGGTSSWARDINKRDTVVGGAELPGGAIHAFAWRDGMIHDLGTLGGSTSWADAVSEHGEIVGAAALPGDVASHAVAWDRFGVTDLGTLGGQSSAARDVNSQGVVVGWSDRADGTTHAFRWHDDKTTDLGTLGGSFSFANGVNKSGDVVGVSTLAGDVESRAFLVVADRMLELDALLPTGSGWSISEAFAIDDKGRIAAQATLEGQTHAVLLVPSHAKSEPN